MEGANIRINRYSQIVRQTITTAAVALVSFGFVAPVYADQLDDQINALKTQAAQQQAEAGNLHAKANDARGRVNELNAQIAALQTQINLNNAKSAQLSAQIAEAESKLTESKKVLAANIKDMYLNSSVSPLEVLVSSNSIGDFFNQQEYRDKIKLAVQDAMKSIQDLKKSLDNQHSALELVLTTQQTQRQELSASRAEAASLASLAASDASAADKKVKESNTQVANLKAQQAAILAARSSGYSGSIPGASGGSGGACDNGHGNGGYPMNWCDAPQDYYGQVEASTPWGYSRECVSWAGWRRHQLGLSAGAWGNANTWDDNAPSGSVHSSPQIHAIAQTDAGGYGHVAVVEAIQGSNVVVSEMNYDNHGHFRYGVYPTSFFENYIW